MTIAELKKELEKLPDDATAYFTLWTATGPKSYWFNPSSGTLKISKSGDREFARIAFTDDCRMYKLVEDDAGNPCFDL